MPGGELVPALTAAAVFAAALSVAVVLIWVADSVPRWDAFAH